MTKTKKTKIPTVVLDCDDTVVQFVSFLCYLFNAKFHTSLAESDLTDWDFTSTKITDHQGKIIEGSSLRQFFIDYEDVIYSAIPPIRESVFAMTLMKTLGFKIVVLTARREKFAKATEINFLYNNIPFDEIVFGADKVKEINRLAKTHSIALFADDKYSYVKAVNETDKVDSCCLINRSHNKNITDLGDIKRINDLLEVVRYLPEVTEKFTDSKNKEEKLAGIEKREPEKEKASE